MSFKTVLQDILNRVDHSIGAVFIDSEGETIDHCTRAGEYDILLAGAHHGVIIHMLENIIKGIDPGAALEGVSIRLDNNIYTSIPVEDETYLVLVQDGAGMASEGLRALREAVPRISSLM